MLSYRRIVVLGHSRFRYCDMYHEYCCSVYIPVSFPFFRLLVRILTSAQIFDGPELRRIVRTSIAKIF